MDKKKIQEYLEQLQKIDDVLNNNSEDEIDLNFMDDMNEILLSLSNDVDDELNKSVNKNILNVKVKKLNQNAVVPSYSKPGDAGLDITATEIISNTEHQVEYGTGLSFEVPDGYVMLIFPRSSIKNYELTLSNSVGVLDSGYRGELKLVFNKTHGLDSIKYNIGDRIGQIMIIPYPQVNFIESESLSESERNTGGFGSTGIK